jgi:spore coat polysaccharide biosynthesis protein SpsF (cytidylyltransferase family)
MNSIVLIQARTNSSRLPAKVLLPINEIPIILLCANRAANTGREIVILTSDNPADDYLSKVLAKNKIKSFRGDLDNVLSRFFSSLITFADDDLVFRLTADNVFPDGELLDKMEKHFISNNLNYLICNGEKSNLPYGVSAELMKVKCIREAFYNSLSDFDREHVTGYVKKIYGEVYFKDNYYIKSGNLRCTIDYLDDYLKLQKIFSDESDPSQSKLNDLIKKLILYSHAD